MGVIMVKFLMSAVLLFSEIIGAAALPPSLMTIIDNITEPATVLERPGLYRITVSRGIVLTVRDELISAFGTEADPVPNEVTCFDEALSNLIYPHPSTINIDRKVWSNVRQAIYRLRKNYALGAFDTCRYATPLDCISAFEAFIDAELRGEGHQQVRSQIKEKLNSAFRESVDHLQSLLEKYIDLFEAGTTSFRKLSAESYVRRLLNADVAAPIDEQKQRAIDILISRGFLELFGSITDRGFDYSPRLMVGAYLAKNGPPSEIVLGCGHANRTMLEDLGLPEEVWCGSCDRLPHAGALVISLHESSADVLCNLNNPDFWVPIDDNSVDSVRDETWSLSCYETSTLDHIARVLKIGGAFESNGHSAESSVKVQLLERGFEIVEEKLESDLLKMRKIR